MLRSFTQIGADELSRLLKIGDVVFIDGWPFSFKKLSEATRCWANHVGIVVGFSEAGPLIAQSTFPFSKITPFSSFAAFSARGRIAVRRLKADLTKEQQTAISRAAHKRLGILFDWGFNYRSKGQFCSRFVHEVINEATSVELGEIETFWHNGQKGVAGILIRN